MVLRRAELLRALGATTGDYVALAPAGRTDSGPQDPDDHYTHALLWSGNDADQISGADANARLPGREIHVMATYISPVLICVKAAELYG
jgi:hypothetical protein